MLDEDAKNKAVGAFMNACQSGQHEIFFDRVNGKDAISFFSSFVEQPENYTIKLDWSDATSLLKRSGVEIQRYAFAALYHRKTGGLSYDRVCGDYGVGREEVIFLEEVFDRLSRPLDFLKLKLEDFA